ncbi:hypothetical protein MIR68_004340 [Amoeboaphelidium protococcarum]|nr:hypothetical protein MIR68_004340 [Amoeboaphelidium protococcarum]
MQLSKEEIQKHLDQLELPYTEEILDQFVQEFNNQPNQLNAASSYRSDKVPVSSESYDISTPSVDSKVVVQYSLSDQDEQMQFQQDNNQMEFSRQQVLGELKQMGYHDVPEDVIDDILFDLHHEQRRLREDNIHEASAPPPINGMNFKRAILQNHVDLSSVRQLIRAQRQQQQSTSDQRQTSTKHQRVINQFSSRPKYNNKTDVVKMYHMYRKIWDNDQFLQRQEGKLKPKKMFNGIGYKDVM